MKVPESKPRFFFFALMFILLGMASTALVFGRSAGGVEELVGMPLLALLGAGIATASRGASSKSD